MLQREVFRTQRRALHKPPSRTTSWRTASTVCGTGGEGDDVNGDAPAGPVGDLGPVGDAPAGPVGDAPAGPGGDDAVVPAGTIPQHVLGVLRQRLGQDLPCSSISSFCFGSAPLFFASMATLNVGEFSRTNFFALRALALQLLFLDS